MEHFDLIIVGAGSAAFAAAIRANELEAKTAMINIGLPLGGTCVNVGCVPSKTLIHSSEILHHAKNHGVPGIELEVKRFDFQRVIEGELALVARLRQEKYENVLKNLEYVSSIEGHVTFVSEYEIEIDGQKLSAEKFIIAAGSTANVPPIEGITEVGFLTHIEVLKPRKQPKELIVMGGGPLGLEFAQVYSRFGTRVIILQRASSIFPPGERELTDRLTEILQDEGVTIKTNVEVKSARKEKSRKVVSYLANGKEEEIAGEEILLAAGKTPNTKNLGLEKIGVLVDHKQGIVVNQFFQTSQPHIFATGDVTNLPLRLETTAAREGTLAAENALTNTQKSIDYGTVPYTIFTDPQLAGVGFTEEEQMRKMGVCACRTVSFADIPKANIIRRTEGLIKMAVHPETGQIFGVHILAPNAGDLIAQAMTLILNRNTIDDVISSLPMFPTLSEAIKTVALAFTKDISKLSCCI